MGEFTSTTCPNCGKEVKFKNDNKTTCCPFCGGVIESKSTLLRKTEKPISVGVTASIDNIYLPEVAGNIGSYEEEVIGRSVTSKDKPLLPWTTRLGEIGETVIKSRLLYFSNPTKYGLDVGLDYYCELTENDSPSIPFYVQAKSTGHLDENYGRYIDGKTIRYWLEQPYPVFLIFYDDESTLCYWVAVEDIRYELTEALSKNKGKSISASTTNRLELGRNKNQEFIKKIMDSFLSIELNRGHPRFKGKDYIKEIPPPPRTEIEIKRIRSNIRGSLYSLIQHYTNSSDFKTAETCCLFLTEFDKSHYNHFLSLARIYVYSEEKEKARKFYREALDICNRDQKWPRESMKALTDLIKKEMALLS